jgi:hypothetical protein
MVVVLGSCQDQDPVDPDDQFGCVITQPQAGSELVKDVTVQIESEVVGDAMIDYVDFYVNDSLYFRDQQPFYKYKWDLEEVPEGDYTLRAEAVDGDGNTRSDEIDVTVTIRNHALKFDGQKGYLLLPDDAVPRDKGTIEYWFQTRTLQDPQVLVYTGNMVPLEEADGFGSSEVGFEFHTGIHGDYPQKYWKYQDGDPAQAQMYWRGYEIQPFEWYHFALTYDVNGNFHVYLDGELQAFGVMAPDFSGSRPYQTLVGKPLADEHYFQGRMDELRIWNTTLSQQTIQQNMSDTVGRNHPDLHAYYRFDLKRKLYAEELKNGMTATMALFDRTTQSYFVSDAFE